MSKTVLKMILGGAFFLSVSALQGASVDSPQKSAFEVAKPNATALKDTPFAQTGARGIKAFCKSKVNFQSAYKEALQDPNVLNGKYSENSKAFQSIVRDDSIKEELKKELKKEMKRNKQNLGIADVNINKMAIEFADEYFKEIVEKHGGWDNCLVLLKQGSSLTEESPRGTNDSAARALNFGQGSSNNSAYASHDEQEEAPRSGTSSAHSANHSQAGSHNASDHDDDSTDDAASKAPQSTATTSGSAAIASTSNTATSTQTSPTAANTSSSISNADKDSGISSSKTAPIKKPADDTVVNKGSNKKLILGAIAAVGVATYLYQRYSPKPNSKQSVVA